jgi:hypothetical protein
MPRKKPKYAEVGLVLVGEKVTKKAITAPTGLKVMPPPPRPGSLIFPLCQSDFFRVKIMPFISKSTF